MAAMGAKKIIISCTGAHKRKKCGIQKDKKCVVKFLACPVFELRMLIMQKHATRGRRLVSLIVYEAVLGSKKSQKEFHGQYER